MNATRLAACDTTPAKAGNNAKLPNPFKFNNGKAVATKEDWACRREEMRTMLQQFELGTKPPKPEKVTGTFSGNSLSITSSVGGKTMTFSVSIKLPSGGAGPYPVIIGNGGSSLPSFPGVATMMFNNNDIAANMAGSDRGKGKFYSLYPGSDAGALTAWAWAVSRIIDVLEETPAAKIDPKRVAITGCSRNGKGALTIGALDDRIALVIPEESGSGGTACWRLCDAEGKSAKVQTASQIVTENVWFSKKFDQYSKAVNTLPYDHHFLLGLVAPRGMITIDNAEPKWLGPMASWGCSNAARTIYDALGAQDNFGETLASSHPHCSFPAVQKPEVEAFVNKFLLGQSSVATKVFKAYTAQPFEKSQWIDWTTPKLT
ncbi:hypothetical protein BT63DRAFT_370104 [Microthyrium microscopicum]|uniref:(4-O-methyl)-D-glucuronate--lignin esterase n=1 Tax=Microthyrium microscopicum TaxID=703497 RepID=A0A6A6UJ52_9PEZI|nr:hypothetical protein BT63DRAFT_370104 [Microthyrium microscopicum]